MLPDERIQAFPLFSDGARSAKVIRRRQKPVSGLGLEREINTSNAMRDVLNHR